MFASDMQIFVHRQYQRRPAHHQRVVGAAYEKGVRQAVNEHHQLANDGGHSQRHQRFGDRHTLKERGAVSIFLFHGCAAVLFPDLFAVYHDHVDGLHPDVRPYLFLYIGFGL